jgi:gluconolactonase
MRIWVMLIGVIIMIGCQGPVEKTGVVEKIGEGLNFAEGPAWSSRGVLYVSNCYGNWLAQIQNSQLDTFVTKPSSPDTFSSTNGLTVGKDGYLYGCDFGIGAIVRFNMQGECFIYASGYQGIKFNRPNDLAFDPEGNLYFTDPNKYDKEQRDGRVFRIERETGEVVLVAENLAFPNGIAFSADAKNLYICESAMNRIIKYSVNKEGTLGDKSEFVKLPNGDPDGIAFDQKGNIYAAHYGTGTVFVIDPEGKIISEIKIPDGEKTTNVDFGGPDMRTLFITDAKSNAVYKVQNSVPGLKLFYSD